MLKNYLTLAFRTLMRNKLYSGINVLGLAIGISACLVIFLIVNFELSFDRFHPDGDRIYRVYSQFSGDYNGVNRGVPAAIPATAKKELTGIGSSTGFHLFTSKVSVPNAKNELRDFDLQKQVIVAGPEYFEVFRSYQWLAGSPAVLDKPFQVVLTESKAKTYFGITDAREAVGREIHYRDSLIVSVAGIIKDLEQHTDLDFTDFISLNTVPQSWIKKSIRLEDWESTNSGSQFFIKSLPGTPPSQLEGGLAKLAALYKKKQNKDWNWKVVYRLQPLSDLHFNSELEIFDNSNSPAHIPTLKILVLVAVMLLLIAAINFINLETAQAMRRAKEVGLRKVMGSTRGRLILQFLMQSALLTLFAVALSLPIASLALVYFSDFIPPGVHLQFSDSFTLVFLFLSLVVVSFLAGFYPAFSLSSFLPALALKNQTQAGTRLTRSGFVRKGLIIFQFTFAQILIVATLVAGRQISFMLNKDLGFDKEAIIYFQTPWWEKSAKVQLLKNELAQLPEIKRISLNDAPPSANGWSSDTFKFNNGHEELHHNVFRKYGDTEFLGLYNIKLLAGRNVMRSDTVREFLINETYAKLLGFQKPEEAIGKEVINNDKKYPIVGVVKDFHMRSLHTAIDPVVIANEEKNFTCFGIKLANVASGDDIKKATDKIETAWKKIYPEKKFEFQFLDETIAKFYEREQRTAKLVRTATAVAILISCLGLFGLASFTAVQRTKEIGIRKVLGATVNNIVSLLSKEFLKLVMVAFVIAVPVAYYISNQWLTDFVYRITVGWWIFACTILASITIALLSVSYQAIKAATADPVASLRYE